VRTPKGISPSPNQDTEPPASDFEFDAEERVLNIDPGFRVRVSKVVSARAQPQDSLAIDSRQPRFAKFRLDLLDATSAVTIA
jgi:hypothetical protein